MEKREMLTRTRIPSAALLACTCFVLAGFAGSVEVHFENKDGGFFLKHARSEDASLSATSTSEVEDRDSSMVLSVDRFTVLQTAQPVAVRATYGPFSTKQTVPARYIVPDPLEPLPTEASSASSLVSVTLNGVTHGLATNSSAPLSAVLDIDLYAHNLDISAHLVTPEVQRDSPVMRVLFHTGQSLGVFRHDAVPSAGIGSGGAPMGGPQSERPRVCIVLHASLEGATGPGLAGTCSPEGRDGICLAQVTLPASWWPSALYQDGKKPVKPPRTLVQAAYSVFEPWDEQCVVAPMARVQIQPVTPLASVPLVHGRHGYREVRSDEMVHMLVPQGPLYPNSRVYIPVYLDDQVNAPISFFVIRARVKSGLKILGAEVSSDHWNVSVELNPKQTSSTVTAFRKDRSDPHSGRPVVEVFSWFLAVEEPSDFWEGGKIVWTLRYVLESTAAAAAAASKTRPGVQLDELEEERRKMTTRLDIQKDEVQAVLPISKNWELINTAVLTGKQVSQPMKVFIVSQAGKVADVTLQSSCHSEDESVLKVSSSCTSVYVDGSEIRGSTNASVMVKYGTYNGNAKFIVWMPEFQLQIDVSDPKLNQIRGWRVPHGYKQKVKRYAEDGFSKSSNFHRWQNQAIPDDLGGDSDRYVCRLRFQQSGIEVYARFFAEDQDSGRVSYFLSRKTYLRMTDLVQNLLRVADSRIASLKGRILQGLSMGRTEVQVISPITGRVIGAKEVRVASDKVGLSSISVTVISGLQLTIIPDGDIENGYVAETSVSRKLTAKYQEGLLDIDLHFSDGSRTPLREVSTDDYYLSVDSLNSSVVAFAPMMASHHPRVIAVGQGEGDLLKVALELADECHRKNSHPMAAEYAHVEVDFSANQRPEFVQNDGNSNRESGSKSRKGGRNKKNKQDIEMNDLSDILIRDENNNEPTVQARQHLAGKHGHLTPLEIGMYVLLGVFCIAIVIFVISCIVYASKFKKKEGLKGDKNDSTTNAHDWVWLGRATLERASTHNVSSQGSVPMSEAGAKKKIRITSNPNYNETCLENPSHVQLPSRPIINSTTYNKHQPTDNPRQQITFLPNPPPPSPPPPPVAENTNVILNNNNVVSAPPIPPHLDVEAEYKPPVPPHRNIGVTARISPTGVHPPGKHPKQILPRVNLKDGAPCGGIRVLPGKSGKSHMAANRDNVVNERKYSEQSRKGRRDDDDEDDDGNDPGFVDLFPESAGSFRGKDSPQVKRATIVGNPMFSAGVPSTVAAAAAEQCGQVEGGGTSEVGLDLNLGMDYDQLMEYFDNLKESNA